MAGVKGASLEALPDTNHRRSNAKLHLAALVCFLLAAIMYSFASMGLAALCGVVGLGLEILMWVFLWKGRN